MLNFSEANGTGWTAWPLTRKVLSLTCILQHRGREPMAREPDVALSMTAFGSLANRDISKSVPSLSMLSTFATNHALLKIMLYKVIFNC